MTMHDAGEMAGTAVTRPRAAKPRRKRARPPRKRRGKRPGTHSDASALLDRMRHHALGVADMTSTQLRAAEIVLKSAKATDDPESHPVRKIVSAEPLSEEEWAQQYVRPAQDTTTSPTRPT